MKALTYVEIDVDRCADTFGAAPCAAAVQADLDATLYYDFDKNDIYGFTPTDGAFVAGVRIADYRATQAAILASRRYHSPVVQPAKQSTASATSTSQ
jgi:hypothetical protein